MSSFETPASKTPLPELVLDAYRGSGQVREASQVDVVVGDACLPQAVQSPGLTALAALRLVNERVPSDHDVVAPDPTQVVHALHEDPPERPPVFKEAFEFGADGRHRHRIVEVIRPDALGVDDEGNTDRFDERSLPLRGFGGRVAEGWDGLIGFGWI